MGCIRRRICRQLRSRQRSEQNIRLDGANLGTFPPQALQHLLPGIAYLPISFHFNKPQRQYEPESRFRKSAAEFFRCKLIFMRTLYGMRVPDGARLVEVRAVTSLNARPRIVFRGPLEEHGVTLTEDAISDAVATDSKFWDWVGAQVRQRRISADNTGDGGLVRLKLSISFINQDASLAILDESSGATSVVTGESWEFYKSSTAHSDQMNPMVLVERFITLMVDQQKELPNQVARILKEVTDTGRVALQTSAAESSKILQASIEPLKAQMALIEKSHSHETARADKASDAVIRMLNNPEKDKSSTVDELVKLATAAPAILAIFEKVVEKVKKGVN